MVLFEQHEKFFCAPGGVFLTQAYQNLFRFFRHDGWGMRGALGSISQAGRAFFFVAVDPLVSGFSADAELAAEFGHAAFFFFGAQDESHFFIHNTGLFPRHGSILLAFVLPESVTYVLGLMCYLCIRSVPGLGCPQRARA